MIVFYFLFSRFNLIVRFKLDAAENLQSNIVVETFGCFSSIEKVRRLTKRLIVNATTTTTKEKNLNINEHISQVVVLIYKNLLLVV